MKYHVAGIIQLRSTSPIGQHGELAVFPQVNTALARFGIDESPSTLFEAQAYANCYPDCDPDLADVNDDGSVDAFDIEPFIALLFP